MPQNSQPQSNPLPRKLARAAAYAAYLATAAALLLLLFEGGLRLFLGLPRGLFHFRPLDNQTLYLPNSALYMAWGKIPYTIETNSLGLRGPEITPEKPPGVRRIAAIGDSITDGFFVDNPDTYPVQLEAILRERGHPVEVVNLGHGDISIGREYEILRRFGMPLDPCIVLLTFCSNDIDAIHGLTGPELAATETFVHDKAAASSWLFFGRSAIGETLLDAMMRRQFPNYRANRYKLGDTPGPERYDIPGGADFAKNVQIFLDHYVAPADGVAGYRRLEARHIEALRHYQYALAHMHAYCQARGVTLVFAYFPDYNHLYAPGPEPELPQRLREACDEIGIPFLDLAPAFLQEPGAVLHLAPIDFHPNPKGNRVIAKAFANFLEKHGLL